MSIIEKALDKSEKKGAVRREGGVDGRPKGDQRRAVKPPASAALGDGEPPVETTLARPVKAPGPAAPQVLVEDTPRQTKRPEFPRQTLKHASIDLERLAAAGIITPETHQASLVEQFRIIKRPIIMKAAQTGAGRVPNGNLVLVTSAVPGEGKTYTAINLAMSIAAELDHTVLLVDADPAKSDVSRMLGIQEAEGLMDYLAQSTRALSELLVKTDVAKLSVLPSGAPRANTTELLASEDMRRFADELAARYSDRIVIFDSPPLLATSSAGVLARLVGQTVMVVEAIRTPQGALREALELLEPIHNVGLVLNKSRESFGPGYQYGQYYGYGSTER